MISVLRIMGIETEYALLDARDADADPGELAADLLFAYARAAATEDGVAATAHVPARGSRQLLEGAGCRFDYSGERPRADARGHVVDELPEEARTDEAPEAVLTGARTMWVPRITDFESHHYRGSATHAPNGARLYVDHTHPEYAAPEALGPLAAARYDRTGDAVMVRAVAALNAQQPGRSAVVVKNNTDGRGQAWGAHESYLMDRATDWGLIADVLMPFLATRAIIGGSGRVGLGTDSEQAGFQIFQRADFIEQRVSLFTTRERPIVNTRDEPHSSPGRWRRLHVITADSSMLAVTSLLRLGSLAAVLSLVENHPDAARDLADRVALADPVAAVRSVSRDLGLAEQLPLARGTAASALDIQREFLAAVRGAVEDAPDEQTAQVLTLWDDALRALETVRDAGGDAEGQDAMADAATMIEWCAKYRLLQRLLAKYGCGWEDQRIAAADLQFSMVDPRASFALALERCGAVRRVVAHESVRRAEFEAPADTRAGGRAALLAAYPQDVWAAGWTSLVVDIGSKHLLRVELTDPHHPTAAQARAAIESTDSLCAALQALGTRIPEDPVTLSWDEGVYAPDEDN